MSKHYHKWHLAKYIAKSVIDGESYAIFVCDCGLIKYKDLHRE